MPEISIVGLVMPESPIRKLVPFAEEAVNKGKKVYHLNIGQPDIETPKEVLEAIKTNDLNVVQYSHSAGNASLRNNLSKYYKKQGITIEPSQLLVTTGGSEAILFCFLSCLNQGDEVIIPEPFYANYNGFAIEAGVKIIPVTSKIENGFALPSIADFEKLISSKTKAILICNPGNPTGYLYSEEELNILKEIVAKHDIYLIVDEVYREFCYDGKQHYSIMNIQGLKDNAIMVDSVSKRYSLCGARIGMVVTRNRKLMETILKFAQARLSPPTYGQICAEAALQTPQRYFDQVIEEYRSRRDLVVTELNKMEGVICPKPSGAFYVIAKLPVDSAEDFCKWMLKDFEYEGQTVMLAPAEGFYSTYGLGKQEVRIAYVLNKEDLSKAMVCLSHALKTYPGRSVQVQ